MDRVDIQLAKENTTEQFEHQCNSTYQLNKMSRNGHLNFYKEKMIKKKVLLCTYITHALGISFIQENLPGFRKPSLYVHCLISKAV